ncbi:MAG: hypothetical protein RLZ10_2543 [Bacteroidota bacterium]|jgi:hypothetical protein
MIKFKIIHSWFKKSYIEVPSCYEDLTYRQFQEIQGKTDDVEIIKNLTGLEIEVFEMILPYMGWMKTKPDFTKYEPSNYLNFNGLILIVPNIRECHFGQKIIFADYLKRMRKEENTFAYIHKLVATYLRESIDTKLIEVFSLELLNCSFIDVYCVYLNLIKQWENLIKVENKMPHSNADDKEKPAGIDDLKVLGDFNTIDLISTRNGYTHKEVELLPYNDVYLILYRINLLSIFEKNYRRITAPKQ